MSKDLKLIQTNNNCVGCNKCIRTCVCTGALVARETEDKKNFVDVDYTKCIGCGSCFDVCEQNAREFYDDTELFFDDLKKGEKISILLAPSFMVNYKENYREIIGALKELGVNHVLNIGFGADISVWGCVNYMLQNDFVGGLAQPCPTVVNYIERYASKLIPKLFPVQSPMMCSAIYARNEMNITDKFAFIGPCISKKDEQVSKRGKNYISYNVTFSNLMKYIRENNIEGKTFEGEIEVSLGSIFPSSGGLSQNIQFYLGEDLLIRQAEGEKDMYNYLLENIDCLSEKEHPYDLIDILNCTQGCCYGTGSEDEVGKKEQRLIELTFLKRKIKNSEEMKNAMTLTPEQRLEKLNERFSKLNLEDYLCSYDDLSEVVKVKIPNKKELKSIFIDMNKNSKDEMEINCSCCGFNTCTDFATAIHNGLSYKENCVYYIRDEIEKERDKARKAEIYHHLAMRDIQTGLFNRNAYYEWYENTKDFSGYSIISFDLNNLKVCNDTFGHSYGDIYIKESVNVIRKHFDDIGSSYRFGGDEFVTIVENTNIEVLERKIKAFTEYLSKTKIIDVNFNVGISMGYAVYDSNIDETFSDTEKRADASMYKNKEFIKNKKA